MVGAVWVDVLTFGQQWFWANSVVAMVALGIGSIIRLMLQAVTSVSLINRYQALVLGAVISLFSSFLLIFIAAFFLPSIVDQLLVTAFFWSIVGGPIAVWLTTLFLELMGAAWDWLGTLK